MVKHGKARAEETSGGSVNAVFRFKDKKMFHTHVKKMQINFWGCGLGWEWGQQPISSIINLYVNILPNGNSTFQLVDRLHWSLPCWSAKDGCRGGRVVRKPSLKHKKHKTGARTPSLKHYIPMKSLATSCRCAARCRAARRPRGVATWTSYVLK